MVVLVMYNACFGGFEFSDTARSEYLRRSGKEDVDFYSMSRTDAIMVQIVQEMGLDASGLCSEIRLREIDDAYAGCFEIVEYDGHESVVINYDRFALNQVRTIMHSPLGDGDKVTMTINVLAELDVADRQTVNSTSSL